MPYKKPLQKRSIESEAKFLIAMDNLLREKSFEDLTVEEISCLAGLTKSAFLQRFGTKEQALFVLFSKYADEASGIMEEVTRGLDSKVSIEKTLSAISSRFDQLLHKHFSANRAMNEYIKRRMESHDLTKKIFGECIQMMSVIQRLWFAETYSIEGAKAAAQLLVSLNFHYTMRAMPAFPADAALRHQLFAELIVVGIKR